MKKTIIALFALFVSSPLAAQMIESRVTASNGVTVTLNSDEFAGRFEYTAPSIKFGNGQAFALVASIKEKGQAREPFITGSIMYSDRTWRMYNQAILRGGETVDAVFADRDVVSCRGSRYSGCSYSEGFQLKPTAAQISKYAVDGFLAIQLKGSPGSELILEVPVEYLSAVKEVSSH